MRFTTASTTLSGLRTDLLVLGMGIGKGGVLSPLAREIDRKLGGRLSRIIRKERLRGKAGETRLIDTSGKMAMGAVLLVGLGEGEKIDSNLLRKIASSALKTGNRIRGRKITIEDLSSLKGRITAEVRGQCLAEGCLLGNYSFDLYKSDRKDNSEKAVKEIEILTREAAPLSRGLKKGALFAEATNFARDLINTPAADMTPRRMSEEARKIGRLPRLSVKIYDRRRIEKMGMGCYLAVAKGSEEPPYFVHLHYRPPGRSRKVIAIVGKGVTFDSGGLSLKTASSMETMKDDMSGAAAMLAIMRALATLKPPVEVHGISAITENMPSGGADKPGDIAWTMKGKTVEILNTDAEGRLTLADALHYALRQKPKPDTLIDIATLTGACVMALGDLCAGIMGNDQKLIDQLIDCGKAAGERIWQLPLIEEYREDLKSPIADLKNIGGRWGGAINGGLFLQEFVDPKIPWAHIDIAGPSWTEKDLAYCPRGGTGHSVRTLLNFILCI